jgi:hypothetical protein
MMVLENTEVKLTHFLVFAAFGWSFDVHAMASSMYSSANRTKLYTYKIWTEVTKFSTRKKRRRAKVICTYWPNIIEFERGKKKQA